MKARKLTPSTLHFSEQELTHYAQRLQQMIRCKTVSVKGAVCEDSEYHGPADMTKPQFAYAMECIQTVFPQYPVSPMILPAGTDARTLTEICPCVLRFAPITLSQQQLASVHAENENIDLRAIGEAVAFYKQLVRNYPS